MARLHAAVAADIKIPAVFGGDNADILALRFGAFTGAAGHREFDFMRGAQALVAVFQLYRQPDAVIDAVAAPGAADAGFNRAQGFAVGMAGFETGIDQFFPDMRQLIDPRTEQIHALAAGDFGVELVFFADLPQGNQHVGADFAAGDARHDRISAVFLHIGQKGIVGVL